MTSTKNLVKAIEYAEELIDIEDLELDAKDRARLVMIIIKMMDGKNETEMEQEKERVHDVVKLFG